MKVIGKGTFSCVVYPSINSSNDLNMVGKIGISRELSEEYYRIIKLPKNSPYLYYNVNTSFLTIKQSEEIIDIANLKISKGFKLGELRIPLINGQSLAKFLNKFKLSPFFDYYNDKDGVPDTYQKIIEINASRPKIEFTKWVNLLKAFIDFYDKVEQMNLEYSVFHNDIHTGNIMYDGYKLYLVDWAPVPGFGHYD